MCQAIVDFAADGEGDIRGAIAWLDGEESQRPERGRDDRPTESPAQRRLNDDPYENCRPPVGRGELDLAHWQLIAKAHFGQVLRDGGEQLGQHNPVTACDDIGANHAADHAFENRHGLWEAAASLFDGPDDTRNDLAYQLIVECGEGLLLVVWHDRNS